MKPGNAKRSRVCGTCFRAQISWISFFKTQNWHFKPGWYKRSSSCSLMRQTVCNAEPSGKSSLGLFGEGQELGGQNKKQKNQNKQTKKTQQHKTNLADDWTNHLSLSVMDWLQSIRSMKHMTQLNSCWSQQDFQLSVKKFFSLLRNWCYGSICTNICRSCCFQRNCRFSRWSSHKLNLLLLSCRHKFGCMWPKVFTIFDNFFSFLIIYLPL